MNSSNSARTRRDCARALLIAVLTAGAAVGQAKELAGIVRLDGNPVAAATVRVEQPGGVVVTTTDGAGRFRAKGLNGPRAAVSVVYGGRLVYRAIHEVAAREIAIDLRSAAKR